MVTLLGEGFNQYDKDKNKVTMCGLPVDVMSAEYGRLVVKTVRMVDT